MCGLIDHFAFLFYTDDNERDQLIIEAQSHWERKHSRDH